MQRQDTPVIRNQWDSLRITPGGVFYFLTVTLANKQRPAWVQTIVVESE